MARRGEMRGFRHAPAKIRCEFVTKTAVPRRQRTRAKSSDAIAWSAQNGLGRQTGRVRKTGEKTRCGAAIRRRQRFLTHSAARAKRRLHKKLQKLRSKKITGSGESGAAARTGAFSYASGRMARTHNASPFFNNPRGRLLKTPNCHYL
jgi:hypothetical protein